MAAGVLVPWFAISNARSAVSRSRASVALPLAPTAAARALFLRCHVPAGGGRTIQIDSHNAEAQASDQPLPPSWGDVASLRCDGSPACVRELADRRSVVFEVRRRRPGAVLLGRAMGSEQVGCAEVARWPGMSVHVSETAAPARRRGVEYSAARREACTCEWSAGEEDVFGVAACGVADNAFE